MGTIVYNTNTIDMFCCVEHTNISCFIQYREQDIYCYLICVYSVR